MPNATRGILKDPHIQEQILEFIRKWGLMEFNHYSKTSKQVTLYTCYDGIVRRSTFLNFLAANPKFKEKVAKAKEYYSQSLALEHPDIRAEYLERLREIGTHGIVRKKMRKFTKINPRTGEITELQEEETVETTPPRDFHFEMILRHKKEE